MKIHYIHKRNAIRVHKELHPWYLEMLQLCANDLSACGFNGSVQVVFQLGKAQSRDHLLGQCLYTPRTQRTSVYIYTYYQRVMTNVATIAHEFGHVSHFVTATESAWWPTSRKEQYACMYEKLMVERFHAIRARNTFSTAA